MALTTCIVIIPSALHNSIQASPNNTVRQILQLSQLKDEGIFREQPNNTKIAYESSHDKQPLLCCLLFKKCKYFTLAEMATKLQSVEMITY